MLEIHEVEDQEAGEKEMECKIRKAVDSYFERNDLIRPNKKRNKTIADIVIALAKNNDLSVSRFEYYSEHTKRFLSSMQINF